MKQFEGVPLNIAFLADYGVPAGLLRRAADEAAQTGVAADIALLCDGALSPEVFYRCLARHLGCAFSAAEAAVAPSRNYAAAVKAGFARLEGEADAPRCLAAPQGEALTTFLLAQRSARVPRDYFVLTTPADFARRVRAANSAAIAHDASFSLRDRDASLCARRDAGRPRRVVPVLAVCATAAAWAAPVEAWGLLCVLCGLVFLASALVRLHALAAAAAYPAADAPVHDAALPLYTIVLPLYREARMARRLTAALNRLDYPRGKLDIKCLVEEDDPATRLALEHLRLPSRYEIIVAPPGAPRTKPRALNVALPFARGALIVVYDAEDEPDPRQLRAAAARFAQAQPNVVCLQAHLAVDNCRETWLSRLFAVGYAALFDVLNPGLVALGLPVLLGGTSNHFRTRALREAGGWDAWNVTEDADLGLRLARLGLRVQTLASTTLEEAPITLPVWLNQRRRWLKGWFQTAGVHLRDPARLVRELGLVRALCAAAHIGGLLLGSLFWPVLAVKTALDVSGDAFLHPATWGDGLMRVLWSMVAIAGLAALVLPALLGMRRRGLLGFAPWLLLAPVYFVLVTAAAWLGLYDLVRTPFHWRKTEHGLSRRMHGAPSHAAHRGRAQAT